MAQKTIIPEDNNFGSAAIHATVIIATANPTAYRHILDIACQYITVAMQAKRT